MNPNQQRSEKYFQLSSQLAQMDNTQIAALVATANNEQQTMWGKHQMIAIGERKLFVKRVPLTAREQQNSFSTQNLYNLPAYYHYGIGSAGFGVYRELVAHIKTTNWVLSGVIENFPLLYHYRVMPFAGERKALDLAWQQQYVQYWDGNEQIGHYLVDRANADAEMVLFLEHFPHTLQPWLLAQPDQLAWVLAGLLTTIDFLRKEGIIHFDAHFHNVLTDGANVYLTDFGLVLDRNFALNEDELAFFQTHMDHDYGHMISNLVFPLYDLYNALPAQSQQELRAKYGVTGEGDQFQNILFMLLENLEEIQANGVINIGDTYLAHLRRYRAIMLLTGNFFKALIGNPQKDTPFPHIVLRQLLNEAGIHTKDEA